jgi:putative component of toxin-antitoxin plasmid stabilization module
MYADSRPPHAKVSTSRSGKRLAVSVHATDHKSAGSGVRRYTVDWGDGHRSVSRHPVLVHRYSTSGRKRITVTVRDRARNNTVKRLRA